MGRRRTAAAVRACRGGALAALLLALPLLLLGHGARATAWGAERLRPVDPSKLHRTDARGFLWDPNVQGVLRDGTNDCWDGAMALKLNGHPFSSDRPALQTVDGAELVLAGRADQLHVKRRIRFDADLGAARYTEVLRNEYHQTTDVTVEVTSQLGSSARTMLTDTGRTFVGGSLERGESGFVAVHGGGSRPAALFRLRAPRSKLVPSVAVRNGRTFTVSWTVRIAPGASVAIVHTVAQRRWNGPPTAAQLQSEFEPFERDAWIATLPRDVRLLLANHGGALGGEALLDGDESAQAAVLAIAQVYDVERGASSVVFLERAKPLVGTVTGTRFAVRTRLGAVEVDLAEAAVLTGGADLGRSMRLYLRNGEVLAGTIEAPGLRFATEAGLEIPLDPAGLDALFLPEADADGVPPAGTVAYLTQIDGMTLALGAAAAARLRATSPWGDLDLPLTDVVRLDHLREPVAGLWVLLADGTRVPISVAGDRLALTSLRFGRIEVAAGSVAAWRRLGATPPVAGDDGSPPGTHLRLTGDAFLAGTLEAETLQVESRAGTNDVPLERIARIDRRDDRERERPAFVLTLRDGETLEGSLPAQVLVLRTPYGRCHAPVVHLRGYRWIGSAESDEGDEEEDK